MFKVITYLLFLVLLGGCATRLENSREYLVEGDKESAAESLYEHAQERSVKELSSQEYKTGIEFLALLEETNSPELLTNIYKLKYSSISFEKNIFIRSGNLSKKILFLAHKWQMTDLLRQIALQVEEEMAWQKSNKYDKSILEFATFAVLNLSVNQKQHFNLSDYWAHIPYEKYLDSFKNLWALSKSKKATSIELVLKNNFIKRIRENREQIIKVAEREELSFIFSLEKEYTNQSGFDDLRIGMKQELVEGQTKEKVALDEIALLKPRVFNASDRLHKLEMERRDLQSLNQYTFEERVQCRNCSGRGEIQCSPCRGRGICSHCDRGTVDCTRCFRRGYLECRTCRGRGRYRECRKVWDRGKGCYVEKHFRVDCRSCYGSGNIHCGCDHGRAICGRCDGHYQCRTCLGKRFVSCTSCVNGTIVEVRKMSAGKDIDNRIAAAETQQSALLSRLNQLEWLVRREKAKRKTFNLYLN